MSTRKMANIVSNDKPLIAMFSGAILSCIVLISLVVTACVWYI